MKIYLFKTADSNNTVSKALTDNITLEGTLRNECSILSPAIEIESPISLSNYNYAYVGEFNRYYFITDITVTYNGLWRLSLKCDVLMTYEKSIRTLKANILRNPSEFNLMLEDNQLNKYSDDRVQCYNFPNALTPISDNQFKYYLTLIGGGN